MIPDICETISKNTCVMYTKPGCIYCHKLKQDLGALNLAYKEVVVDPMTSEYASDRDRLIKVTNHKTFPQLFISGKFIGGYDSFQAYKTQSMMCAVNDTDF